MWRLVKQSHVINIKQYPSNTSQDLYAELAASTITTKLNFSIVYTQLNHRIGESHSMQMGFADNFVYSDHDANLC